MNADKIAKMLMLGEACGNCVEHCKDLPIEGVCEKYVPGDDITMLREELLKNLGIPKDYLFPSK
jgi:hypothetical protein